MARENPDAVDESWLQDTVVSSPSPDAGTKTAAPPPAEKKPARAARRPPADKHDRDAMLAERSEEVQKMLRGVTSQLSVIQGEAVKGAAKLADIASGWLAWFLIKAG